jgi:hypothetical protein
MNLDVISSRMAKHIKLCLKNLKSDRVKCCGSCPFEEIILEYAKNNNITGLEKLFIKKRVDNGRKSK